MFFIEPWNKPCRVLVIGRAMRPKDYNSRVSRVVPGFRGRMKRPVCIPFLDVCGADHHRGF